MTLRDVIDALARAVRAVFPNDLKEYTDKGGKR